MELLANWGAPDTIGLTGIQFLGANSEPICAECCVIRYSGDQTSTSSLLNASLLRYVFSFLLKCRCVIFVENGIESIAGFSRIILLLCFGDAFSRLAVDYIFKLNSIYIIKKLLI